MGVQMDAAQAAVWRFDEPARPFRRETGHAVFGPTEIKRRYLFLEFNRGIKANPGN
jgi:hypothetical protein